MEIKYKNWLITGGCGFIGINLIETLKEVFPNINIRILDNFSVGTPEDLEKVTDFKLIKLKDLKESPKGIEVIQGDIRDFNTVKKALQGIEVVVHLAANTGVEPSIKNPRLDLESNIIGTFNLLEASRFQKVKKFIMASSNAPLGKAIPPVNEETAPKPISPYGASKLACEGYCLAYYNTFGIETIVLRFGNVYGPYSYKKNSVIAKFIKRALKGEPLEIYGDGTQTRDFIYVKDLVNAIILAANSNIGGEIFQIATFKETSIGEIAEIIKKIFKELLNKNVNIVYTKPRKGDMKRNYANIEKAKLLLGYQPKYSLEEGIKETLNYFLNII